MEAIRLPKNIALVRAGRERRSLHIHRQIAHWRAPRRNAPACANENAEMKLFFAYCALRE
jgi:hypothetical protein